MGKVTEAVIIDFSKLRKGQVVSVYPKKELIDQGFFGMSAAPSIYKKILELKLPLIGICDNSGVEVVWENKKYRCQHYFPFADPSTPKYIDITTRKQSKTDLTQYDLCRFCDEINPVKKLTEVLFVNESGQKEKANFCSKCSSRFLKCSACGLPHSDSLYGNDICRMCRNQMPNTACCGRMKEENTLRCWFCGTRYCHKHIDLHVSQNHSRSTLPSRVDTRPIMGDKPGKIITINKSLGFEIETVFPSTMTTSECSETIYNIQRQFPTKFALAHDGSLKSTTKEGHTIEGHEFLTPPASLNKAEEIVHEICSLLKQKEMTINETCSVHVHVDASGIKDNPVVLSHLLRTVYAVEDLLYSVNPPSRWTSRYCRSLTDKYDFEDFARPISVEDFETKWYGTLDRNKIEEYKRNKYNGGVNGSYDTRYCGINLHSTFTNGTIEFRHHAGSLNPEKILSWAGLLLSIIDYAENRYNDQHIIQLYQTRTTEEKMKLFFTYLDIPLPIQEYVRNRIKKWNPKFSLFKRLMSASSAQIRAGILAQRKKELKSMALEKKQREENKKIIIFKQLVMDKHNTKVFEKYRSEVQKLTSEEQLGKLQNDLNPNIYFSGISFGVSSQEWGDIQTEQISRTAYGEIVRRAADLDDLLVAERGEE